MKTDDFNSSLTSEMLNESMFKKYGKRVDFTKYTREQLEDYRNIIRTQVSQLETSTGFNELLSNESYQQDKHLLSLLNTRIKEMLGESAKKTVVNEKAVSQAQQRAAGIALAAKRQGKKPPGKGAAAQMAKMSTKELEKFAGTERTGLPPKKKKKKTNKSDKQLKEIRQKASKDWDKDGKVESPKDEVWGSRAKAAARAGNPFVKKKPDKNKTNESQLRNDFRMILEGIRNYITEDEEGKAMDITAGADMVKDFTSWMQRLGQYQTKSTIELADSIRSNFGPQEAEQFKSAVTPAILSALEALTASREVITKAVAVLAGEEQPDEMMGEPGEEEEMPSFEPEGDSMNKPPEEGEEDEFAASDAAAGGSETAGREKRESREFSRMKRLAEEHSIMKRLAG